MPPGWRFCTALRKGRKAEWALALDVFRGHSRGTNTVKIVPDNTHSPAQIYRVARALPFVDQGRRPLQAALARLKLGHAKAILGCALNSTLGRLATLATLALKV